MYIRTKKSGKNRYLQVIQSYRDEKGRPRQKVIGTLGKVEDCENEGVIDSLMTSLARFDNKALLILTGKEDILPRALNR